MTGLKSVSKHISRHITLTLQQLLRCKPCQAAEKAIAKGMQIRNIGIYI